MYLITFKGEVVVKRLKLQLINLLIREDINIFNCSITLLTLIAIMHLLKNY